MSDHAASSAFDHFDGDDEQTLLPSGGRDVENLSENDDRRMSQVGQPKTLRNGKGTRSGGITPTESNSDSDEEQQNQLTQLPRRWLTKREWTGYIKEDPCVRNRHPSVVSIFRVPKFLKDTKKGAYVPQRVSLGPYHHGSAELLPMDHHKGRALHRMMRRFNRNRNSVIDSNYMNFANRAMEEILNVENKIRDSYEENIDCDGETLARMLSLNGCFLLEVLRTLAGEDLSVTTADQWYDPIFGEKKLEYAARDIVNDILMVENQIPLIVLRKLLELELNSAVNVEKVLLDVLDGTSGLFNNVNVDNIDIEQWSLQRPVGEEAPHLLGFLHTFIASPPSSSQGREIVDQGGCSISIDCCISECIRILQGKSKTQNDAKSIPHATELKNAGIKFSRLQGGIEAIRFEQKSATIFLPPISIMDDTEIIFRNLIAFEMCKPSEINYVTCYVILMDELIDSEQDVALLSRMGVLTNGLGSDKEVADLFNGLGKGVTTSQEDVFETLRKDVNALYRNKMKVHFAKLVQNHCSSPWKALALAAAIVILLLTVVQTIFSIISVYK